MFQLKLVSADTYMYNIYNRAVYCYFNECVQIENIPILIINN
jgi:hypothetical protein